MGSNSVTVVKNYVVRKHGAYDFDTAYRAVKSWFGAHSYDFSEKKRTEKAASSGRYMELLWEAERNVTDYVRFCITVEIWMRDAKPTEDGKMAGRLEFIFNSKLEKNIEIRGVKKFSPEDEGTFMHFIKDVYERYIARTALEDFEDKLFAETMDLAENVRVAVA